MLQFLLRIFRRKQDLDEEIRSHLEIAAGDRRARGESELNARQAAMREFGNVGLVKEATRDAWGWIWLERLLQDVKYAARQLRRSPGFTLTAVVTLTLGIGVNAAMFPVIDQTLLRRLPFPQASQLVTMHATDAKGSAAWTFYEDIAEWQKQARTLTSLAYYNEGHVWMRTAAGEQQVDQPSVSANLFAVLGVAPALGRSFLPAEQSPGAGKEVILSDPLWRTLFHSDPHVLGTQIKLDDGVYTIVGVMPRGFAFPLDAATPQLWVPAELSANTVGREFNNATFEVLGRLRGGFTAEQARAELSAIERQLSHFYTDRMSADLAPSQVAVESYSGSLVRGVRPALLALTAAVFTVWLIACANVANLMLARGTARQREIAVRGTLGASRLRLLRQLLTESLLLSAISTATGLIMSQVLLRVFGKMLSNELHLSGHLALNLPVLSALLALSVLSALLFGLAPAWLATRAPLEQALRQGSVQTSASRRQHLLQHALVAGEIALSLTLLVACGLLLRTVFELRRVPLGFRTDHILMATPQLPGYRYRNVDVNQQIWQPLVERIRQMHGVEAASLTTVVPLNKDFSSEITFYLTDPNNNKSGFKRKVVAQMRASSPDLQKVFGFAMVKGRFFNDQDTPDSAPVAVVNQAFARLFAPPNGDIVGKRSMFMSKNRPITIVGVMQDFRQGGIDQPSQPEFEFCAPQMRSTDNFYQPTLEAHVNLAIRTSSDPAAIIADVRRVMTEVNPDLGATTFETMDQVVADSMGSQLMAAHLLETFGGAALLVALAGLYGLLAYIVSQRTREMGVRIALGAQRSAIVGIVLRQAGWMLASGGTAGLLLAWFSSRLLATFLYGVKPHDIVNIAAMCALLMASGLAAAYLPARRAASIEPMQALRSE
jgi:predicted permease